MTRDAMSVFSCASSASSSRSPGSCEFHTLILALQALAMYPQASAPSQVIGTQSRGESTRKQRYGESGDRPVVHCLRGGKTQTQPTRAPAAASSGISYVPALGPWKER